MDNSTVGYLEKRLDSHESELKTLSATCQNLAITATKHEEQLQLVLKIIYGCCGAILLDVLYVVLRGK